MKFNFKTLDEVFIFEQDVVDKDITCYVNESKNGDKYYTVIVKEKLDE